MRTTHRLHRGREIEQLIRYGRARDYPLFRVIVRPNRCGYARIAIVVSKKNAKRAVIRNCIRRRTREWMRRKLCLRELSLDIAIIFKFGSAAASRKELYDALKIAAPISMRAPSHSSRTPLPKNNLS